MKDPSGDAFDKMVSKIDTRKLTANTKQATELPDGFEPIESKALNMARMIP